jgi:hypothetical protein
MRKFCVYVHRRNDSGAVFYVGKGHGKRPYTKHGRSKHWHRIVNKHGYSVEIVLDNAPEPCAFTYEMALIAAIGRSNLCNATDGGQGCSGRIMGEAQRQKASKMLKGKSLPKDTVQAARKANFKKVGTRCGLRFDSVTHAAKALNPKNYLAAKVSISLCANGGMKHSYGYEWGFVDNEGKIDFLYVSRMGYPRKDKWKAIKMEYGKSFQSLSEAADWLKLNGWPKATQSALCRAAKTGGMAYGSRWSYV